MPRVVRARAVGVPADRLAAELAALGLAAQRWANGPGERYPWHQHAHDKLLYCLAGGIVFHTAAGDLALDPGDGMELEAGVAHAATVGPSGVECLEAARPAAGGGGAGAPPPSPRLRVPGRGGAARGRQGGIGSGEDGQPRGSAGPRDGSATGASAAAPPDLGARQSPWRGDG